MGKNWLLYDVCSQGEPFAICLVTKNIVRHRFNMEHSIMCKWEQLVTLWDSNDKIKPYKKWV